MLCCFEFARAGDPVAKRQVVESLRPRLEKMAAYYATRTGEDRDDLLQEAWVGLLDALPALDISIGRPDQYLLQRAKWRMLDAVKRARLRRCHPLDESADDVPCNRSGEAAAKAYVGAFTRRLNRRQRTVLNGLMAGMTWREVGAAMGCTSANVAYYVRQIRAEFEAFSGE